MNRHDLASENRHWNRFSSLSVFCVGSRLLEAEWGSVYKETRKSIVQFCLRLEFFIAVSFHLHQCEWSSGGSLLSFAFHWNFNYINGTLFFIRLSRKGWKTWRWLSAVIAPPLWKVTKATPYFQRIISDKFEFLPQFLMKCHFLFPGKRSFFVPSRGSGIWVNLTR